MPGSFGEQFPTRNIQEGHRHQDKLTGLVFRYLGGDPRNDLNWLVDGGRASSDPSTVGWGAAQSGANWYNRTLGALRCFNGSVVASVGAGGGGGVTTSIKSLGGFFFLPNWPSFMYTSSSWSSTTYNALTEGTAQIFTVPRDGNLTRITMRTANVTTGDTMRFSFQDLDADNRPDGGVDQFRDIVIGDGDDNIAIRSGLITDDGTDVGTPRAVVKGDRLAAVLEFDSFVAGSIAISGISSSPVSTNEYSGSNTGSGWITGSRAIYCAIEYDDGTFVELPFGAPPVEISQDSLVTINTDPDEYAIRFTLAAPIQVSGMFGGFGGLNTLGQLYDAGDVVLASHSYNTPGTTSEAQLRPGMFSEDITLEAETVYRVGWRPTTTTGNDMRLWTFANGDSRQVSGMGTRVQGSSRVDGGAWNDSVTQIPVIGLICSGTLGED